MDSISSILTTKNFDEPPEIEKLKQLILTDYRAQSTISLSGQTIVISVGSASLAGSLRLRMPEIKKLLDIERSVSIRIH